MDVVGGQHGLGVALADAVVGDGDGPVAHAVGQPHDLAGVVEAVHGTGLGVQVQFHPLLPFGGGILAGFPLHLEHVIRHDDEVMLVLVVHIVATHDQRGAGFEALPLGHVGVGVAQHFEVDRTRIVGDGGEVDLAAAALDLSGEHVAPDRHLAAVAQVVQAAGIGGFEVFAVEQFDRLVGQRQPFDLEVGRDLLGLEFDRRGLLLQVLLELLRRAGVAGIRQADDGQRAGALLDQFGQHPGQLHALQNFPPCIDADGDAVLPKDHRLAAVEEAVHRHALFLEFLDQQADRFRRDVGVGEIVAQMQFVPGKRLLQRRTKAPAQRLVKRFGAAQADDDLTFCAVQFDPFHEDAAECGAELLVRGELGPDLSDQRFQDNSL